MLVRMMVFGLLFTTVLLLSSWFAARTWSVFAGCRSLWWVAGPMVAVGAYIPVVFAGFARRNAVLDAAGAVTSVAMGALNFAFFAALACWITYGFFLLFRLSPDTRVIAKIVYGLALLATVVSLINAAYVRETRHTIRLRGLPEAWRGKEIALVSDIHLGRVLGRGFSEKVVKQLEALSPHAVFIAGDIFDGPEAFPDSLMEPWKQLHPQEGIYFVSGNHDEFGDVGVIKQAVRRAGIQVLSNEKIVADGLTIIGVDDSLSWDKAAFAEVLGRLAGDAPGASLLLVHQPDNLDVAEKAGVSLQLSGHTHGGQFWPWNHVVNAIFGSAAHGWSRHGMLQLYTSYGVGTWGPPMRLFTKPEIVLLKLENEPESASTRE